jgi:quinol-cytochrome oxidoreductase complex cytochrome b subunit
MEPQEVQAIASRTINLVIGGLALLLGPVLMAIGSMIPADDAGTTGFAPSISAYYSYNFVTRNVFVGCMSAVGLLMLCYRGWYLKSAAIDRLIGLTGCVASLAIANLPCCEKLPPWYKWGHGTGAFVLFFSLAALLIFRFTDRTEDEDERTFFYWKTLRNLVYRVCGAGIIVTSVTSGILTRIQKMAGIEPKPDALLIVELVCLTLFGIGWLTKSRYLLGYRPSKGAFAYRRPWVEKLLIDNLPGFEAAALKRHRKSGTGVPSAPMHENERDAA